jgi:hypothetical protein
METEQAERLITDTLHKLFQFDGQKTQALETAKSDFQTMKKYMDQLQTMYTGPKIEITGYKSGSILKSQEEENINQTFGSINSQMKQPDDSPMEMMLKKLEKHKQSNVDTVIKDDKQQKIEREIYGDDSNLTVLQKEATKISPKVAGDIRVINGKPSIEIVEKIPEGRRAGEVKNIDEEVPGLGKVTDTIGEFFVVNDGIRATTGEDPKTNKKVSVDERILSTLFIIPIAKIGKYAFVWSKGEKAVKRVPNVGKDIKGKGKNPSNFADREKLESHFYKHGNEFGELYKNADEYLEGAKEVIKSGIKVKYNYKGEIRTGYVKFMGNSRNGKAKFEFVGTNNKGEITTYHTESGKKIWKTINGKNIPVINPAD